MDTEHTNNMLPISVIIPTRNNEKTLTECLESVLKNNPAEIIIVDGNSIDNTVKIAAGYTQKIYSDNGSGINYAQQFGAEQANQEYIALVDADIVLPQGTLATLLAELKESNCISMQAQVISASMDTYWERAGDWHFRVFQRNRGIGLSAAVLKTDTILKYKLDSPVGVGSDYDFKIRMEREGYNLGTSSSAVVYHHHRSDMRGFYRQRFRFGRESVSFIQVYGLWHIGFWPPLTRLYWLALCFIKGKPQYIPYFVMDWIFQTTGMIKGFIDLLIKSLKGNKKHD